MGPAAARGGDQSRRARSVTPGRGEPLPGVEFALVFSTWEDGAVTVRSHPGGLIVETFVTGERHVLRSR